MNYRQWLIKYSEEQAAIYPDWGRWEIDSQLDCIWVW